MTWEDVRLPGTSLLGFCFQMLKPSEEKGFRRGEEPL